MFLICLMLYKITSCYIISYTNNKSIDFYHVTYSGLCLQTKLHRELGPEYKIDVFVEPGFHEKEGSVNKQINDKERRAAALEDPALFALVEECLAEPNY